MDARRRDLRRRGGRSIGDVVTISLPTPFAVGAVNVFLLEGDRPTLVDAGPHTEAALDALEEGLALRSLRLEDIALILVTHQHHDHAGLVSHVKQCSGAEVAALEPLARYLDDLEQSAELDDAYAVAVMLRHGMEENVAESLRDMSRATRRFGCSVRVDRVLQDGDELLVNGRRLVVLARPGHSPTDTVFYDPADDLLFAGDHLLDRISSNPYAHAPIGVDDPVARAAESDEPRSLPLYLESLRRTRELEVSTVLPGHGPRFSRHRALIDTRLRMHEERGEAILGRIGGGATAAELARTLWDRLPLTQLYLAISEVLGHLQLLRDAGRVRSVERDGLVRWELP